MANLTDYEYDIFLSHNYADQEWTSKLAERLEQEDWQGRKLKVFFSPWDIRPGQSIPQRIEQALPKSRKVGLILSPDAMKSAWVELERLVTTYITVSARDDRLIPLYRRDCEIPALLRPILRVDFRDDEFFEQSYQTLVAVMREEPLPRGSQKQTGTTRLMPSEIPRPPIVGFVPRSSRDGRNLIELLREELAPQKGQLVALWGAGGVGKTTLAAEVARTLVDDFVRRVVWVSADSRADLPFSTFLDEIARQLGEEDLRKLTPERKGESVRTLVSNEPTLIVLDNFETISAEERRKCLEFLEHVNCSALITTRQKLEHARSIPITGMSPEEAYEFLEVLIEQTQDPDIFALSYRNRLIETGESNPLIMEWIVGQIDLANDPDEVLNELTHGEGDAAHRVFDRSYNLPQLNDGGRAVLLALALFTPSAGRPTLAAVAGMDLGKKRDKERFKKAQETLASLWLIRKLEGGLRLAVAGLTRELTKARLAADPRANTIPQRFVSRFLRFAQAHAKPTREDYNSLELEKDNLLTAAEAAFHQGDAPSVSQFAAALAVPPDGVFIVRGYWDDALRIGEMALNTARSSHMDPGISVWSHNVAIMYQLRGERSAAQRLYNESLAIARKLNHKKGIGNSLHELGRVAQQQGEFEEARRLYDESLEISSGLKDQVGMAGTLNNLGMIAQQQGEIDKAQHLFDESLKASKKAGNQRGIGDVLLNQATILEDAGRLDEASTLYNESLEISKKLGNQRSIANDLRGLGNIAFQQGELAKARLLYDQSLEIVRKLSDQAGLAMTLHELGRLANDQGKIGDARRLYNESLEIRERLGDQSGIAASLHELGLLHMDEEDFQAAEKLFQESLVIVKHLGHRKNYAECLESLGQLRVAQGQFVEALALFEEALAVSEAVGIPFRIAGVKQSLGLLEERKENTARAAHYLRDALQIFQKLRSPKAEDVRLELERIENKVSSVS